MFLQQFPDLIRWLLLFVAGAALGSLLNLAIYRLAFVPRNLSPWSSPPPDSAPRTWADRIPVLGWWFLRRESGRHGRGFWVRPLLIELLTGIALIGFWQWQTAGGLTGYRIDQLAPHQAAGFPLLAWHWFLFQATLLALLTVATFVDFDDQTIPDGITVPGTLFALVLMTFNPSLRLPEMTRGLGAVQLGFLDFRSPDEPVTWHLGWPGLVVALVIVLVWCFALMPKTVTLRYGLVRGVRILLASLRRPRRTTTASVPRRAERRMSTYTGGLAVLALLLVLGVVFVWLAGGSRWDALFSSLLGLAMGGGIVWAVRIVAGYALGVEAMGFGDVTLMCMIGAFTGWQPALLVFVIAPFTSILVALVQLVASGENRLAFGPYLCLATAIVLIGWSRVWNEWAAPGVFQAGGPLILAVILVCLVLMAAMLAVWSQVRRLWEG